MVEIEEVSEVETAAAASSSSAEDHHIRRCKYDVFLSFRGEDTRKTFVDHLYSALVRSGIYTFKDDERLETGESISPALLKAIEESSFAVLVFSKNYASSWWCLDELVKIMECSSKSPRGQTVIPIFYDVTPSDVRNQKGHFGEMDRELVEQNDEVQLYDASLLDPAEATKLFCWKVFNDMCPPEDFKELSDQVIYYCDGLPLALKVLGSALRGKNLDFWKDLLEKLRKVGLGGDIHKKLKIGFDDLEEIGTENIEGILLHPHEREYTIEMGTKAFRKMTKLRLLEIHNACIPKGPDYLPDELRWIDWDKYPSNSLPAMFEADVLVGLQLRRSRLKQLWEGRMEGESSLFKFKATFSFFLYWTTLDAGLIPSHEIELDVGQRELAYEGIRTRNIPLNGSIPHRNLVLPQSQPIGELLSHQIKCDVMMRRRFPRRKLPLEKRKRIRRIVKVVTILIESQISHGQFVCIPGRKASKKLHLLQTII
ncbi:hypothetical protein LguiB_020690 [Lonicera macranthoides]